MKQLPQSNIYSASAEEIGALFDGYIEGDVSRPVLVIYDRVLGSEARNALAKTFESFGYGSENTCLYATLQPAHRTGPAAEPDTLIPLDAQALFLLVEGIDPVCIVCADAASSSMLAQALRCPIEPDAACRAFGRSAVAFRDLTALLATESGKQRAWRLLKSLPKR